MRQTRQSSRSTRQKTPRKLAPLWISIAPFLGVGIAIWAATYFAVPIMVDAGLALIHAWTLAVVGPTALGAAMTLVLYRLRVRPTWREFIERFRLGVPSKRLSWQVPSIVVVIVFTNSLMSFSVCWLAEASTVPQAPLVPEVFLNPYPELAEADHARTFMGEPIEGQRMWLAGYWLVCWSCVAVLSEEIMWRGFALPILESHFGGAAWLINGLLWNVPFHLYTLHTAVSDLPLYFLLPLFASRTQSTWAAIAVHSTLVSLALLLLIGG